MYTAEPSKLPLNATIFEISDLLFKKLSIQLQHLAASRLQICMRHAVVHGVAYP
jgi:hypothetical protein